LFIGFSLFNAPNTLQGLNNQLFAIFMLLVLFSQLVQQVMPLFVSQRSLYEARERPSKAYSWKAFMLCNILVELPWATIASVVLFFCWYYPIGLYRNAEYTDSVSARSGLQFLLVWEFIMFSSTFAHMVIAGIATAETAGNVANFFFSLCLLFCGVLAGPKAMPGFWIFMYRVSPFTYIVGALLGNGVGNAPVVCAETEYLSFDAPPGSTCGEYLSQYLDAAGGYLVDSNAEACQLCPIDNTDTFLMGVSISFSDRWRNFGLILVYIGFNVVAAVFFYWFARVPKGKRFARNREDSQSGDADDIKGKEDCQKDAKDGLNTEGRKTPVVAE
jgi:ATP-binding cassette subfamily G (WHITE) protein 2 (PDR)